VNRQKTSKKPAHERGHETENIGFRVFVAFAFWIITALLVWGITLWLNSWIAPWFAEKLNPATKEPASIGSWYLIATIATWLWIFFATMKWFLVSVPKITGLVSLNLLSKKLYNFGPGLQCRYPWDDYTEDDFVGLEVVTRRHEASYAAADGPSMHVVWLYQYAPRLSQLHVYIRIDESTIQQGFSGIIGGKISQEIARKEAEKARETMDEMETAVLKAIEDPKSGTANDRNEVSMKVKLEKMYGVNFMLVTIEDVDYSPDYQKALEASAGISKFTEAAKAIKEELTGLDDQTTANVVLTIQGRGTRKSISIEGLDGNSPVSSAATMGVVLAETVKDEKNKPDQTEGGQ